MFIYTIQGVQCPTLTLNVGISDLAFHDRRNKEKKSSTLMTTKVQENKEKFHLEEAHISFWLLLLICWAKKND
jgi:hypothetical protein